MTVDNELIHTGTLFAILAYGESQLWADQASKKGWSNYSGLADEGFDDNYKDFFANTKNLSKTWNLLTTKQLGSFEANNAHAKFTAGGLYHGYIETSGLLTDVTTQSTEINGVLYGDSNALVATNGNTLVLAFRGTDGKDTAVLGGEAWTGDGQYLHYEAFRPLIEKVLAYTQNVNHGIENVVVSGHSLGGAMADIFTAVDAHRFIEAGLNLNVVSMASAGLDGDAFSDTNDAESFLSNYDHSVLSSFNENGSPILVTPRFYTGITHSKDRVFFASDFEGSAFSGLTPIDTLANNAHFKTTGLILPNIDNTDVSYSSGWFDFEHGFGAHHNGLIYYKNLDALYESKLFPAYQTQNLIFGIGHYTNDAGWFTNSNGIDDLNYNGEADGSLVGSISADFILGLEGNDVLFGKAGNDLLDGSAGIDTLSGGTGKDKMAGGKDADMFAFSQITESVPGSARDVILDFLSGTDQIDLSKIDANSSVSGDNAFTLIGSEQFKASTQLRFINGIISGNTDSDLQAEFEIALIGVSQLTDNDIIN